jgi:Xaa-Pro dipeptidase
MHSVSERIKKVFAKSDADVMFLINTNFQDSNFLYLTGFTSGVFESTPLIVTKKKLVLPVSILEYEIAKRQRPKEMKVILVNDRKQMRSIMKKYMKSKIVGINGSFIPYAHYKSIRKHANPKRMIDATESFYAARSIKDGEEIKNIRVANAIAKKALENTKKELKIGMTEKQTAARIEYHMMNNGASGSSFRGIVSFNENAALPHHMPDNTRLKPNSIVLMDIGAKYNNYCSDITRSFMFKPYSKSERFKKFKEMHQIVSKAQQIGFKQIRDGVNGSDAHNAASDYIDKANGGKYKGKFIHSLGHAIGLEVHDSGPGLSPNQKEVLKANMVVSNEPGIYVVGFGGVRIEDDVIVTKKGAVTI